MFLQYFCVSVFLTVVFTVVSETVDRLHVFPAHEPPNSFLSSVPVFFFQPAEEDLVWEDEGELLLQDFLSNDLDKCRRPESRDGGGRDRDTSTPMSVVCMDTQPGAGNESKRRDGGSGRN